MLSSLMGKEKMRLLLTGQAINIGNLYRGGEFELETESDKQKRTLQEYQDAKKRGKING